jgi:hypothetical protein
LKQQVLSFHNAPDILLQTVSLSFAHVLPPYVGSMIEVYRVPFIGVIPYRRGMLQSTV